MSFPPIRITETRSYVTHLSSKLSADPPSPASLPSAPLVTFDLHFENLKDYLNSVSTVVNSHGQLLKQLAEELKTRLSVTDMLEVFGALGSSIPDDLGTIRIQPTGDDWKDQADFAISKVQAMAQTVSNLKKETKNTQDDVKELQNDMQDRYTKNETETLVKKTKDILKKSIADTHEELQNSIETKEKRLSERIEALEKKFMNLEQNTFWKIKDVEDLLKLRVNEKFVEDAIRHLESRLKKSLQESLQVNQSRLSDELSELLKEFQKLQHEFSIKTAKFEDLETRIDQKLGREDLEIFVAELDRLKASINSISTSHLELEIREVHLKANRNYDLIQEIKIPEFSDDHLKKMIEDLRLEMHSQQKVEMPPEKPPQKPEVVQTVVENRTDMSEFWKFKEKTIEQLRKIEERLERLNKPADMSLLKKLISSKADSEEVNNELTGHDSKINSLESLLSQHSKDIDALNMLLRKLQKMIDEMGNKSGSALIARRHWDPTNCLSCGRGEAQFGPMSPQVIGVDGRLYKADTGLAKGPVVAEREEYDLGVDVFKLDTHQHAHSREKRHPPRDRLTVVLGRDSSKSSYALNSKQFHRPLSAKK